MFYANKEISRLADLEDASDAHSALQARFFAREMTHLLLNIAIGLRVLDDQMLVMKPDAQERAAYLQRRDAVHKIYGISVFDELTFREVCNKVIHAIVVEPHFTEGYEKHAEDHKNDLAYSYAAESTTSEEFLEPERVKWQHLSGSIRLGGTQSKEQWWHLLDAPEFVAAVNYVLGDA